MRQFIKIKFTFLIFFISSLLLFAGSLFSGCEKSAEKRTYDEIAIPSSQDPRVLLQEMLARGEDPHAFLKGEMPPGTGESNLSIGADTALEEPKASHPQTLPLLWHLPKGWREKPAGGMRLATITNPQSPSLDISIVSLSGVAGGISANLNRWMKQIDLPELDERELDEFLKKQKTLKTQGDLS